jgi:hypothetical protein
MNEEREGIKLAAHFLVTSPTVETGLRAKSERTLGAPEVVFLDFSESNLPKKLTYSDGSPQFSRLPRYRRGREALRELSDPL